MKRKERQHLKENELVQTLAAARDFVDRRKSLLTTAVLIAIIAGAVIAGVVIFRSREDSRGADLLAQAKVALDARVVPLGAEAGGDQGSLPAAATIGATGSFPTEEAKLNAALPKLKVAAETYPDSAAGIEARYHYAAALASLGRSQEALTQFDDVIARAGDDSLYGRMAAFGKADTQAKAGQVDAAIASWKELAGKKDEGLPEDAILMELGRAYQAKGNSDEARKTFTQLVDQYPTSPYVAEARAELDSLKG
jgi:tetratricopeptide (TPR) repeat protein